MGVCRTGKEARGVPSGWCGDLLTAGCSGGAPGVPAVFMPGHTAEAVGLEQWGLFRP